MAIADSTSNIQPPYQLIMKLHLHKQYYATLAAFAAGICLTFLVLLNSGLAKKVGILESSVIAHGVGTLLGLILILPQLHKKLFKKIQRTPKYLFIGGIFGITLTTIANIAAPIIGLLLHLSILTSLDLIFSTLLDHFGLFNLSKFRLTTRRCLGLLLSLTGVLLIFLSNL